MTEKELDNLGEGSNETLVWDNSQEDSAKATRHAQQLAWSKAEVERLEAIALNAQVKLAANDANNLLELYNSDPKLADKVAKKFGYSDFNDAKSTITSWSAIEQKVEDDFDTKYQKKRAEERHQEAVEDANAFIDKSKLDEDLQDQAKDYFTKITRWQQLTRAEAIEFAEMATLYVQKDKIKAGRYEDQMKEISSSTVSNSKKSSPKTDEPIEVVRNWQLVTLSSNKSK